MARAREIVTFALILLFGATAGWCQTRQAPAPAWKIALQQARSHWEIGAYESAFSALQKAFALAPNDLARAQIAFRYADWSHQLGQYEAARHWYQRCLQLAPAGSDLIRRANEGLSRLPAVRYPPVSPAVPEETPVRIAVPLSLVFTTILLGSLLLLQSLSGWKTQAFFLQVLLSLLLAGALTMMLPLLILLALQQVQMQPESWVAGGLTIGSALSLVFAGRSWQQGQLLRNTPLTRLRSAAHGFLKVRGSAHASFGTITSNVGHIEGIYVHEHSERYERHVEQYYDSQSKRWRTRTVYRWVTIYSASQGVDFTLDDGTGQAVVETKGADFYTEHVALFYNYRPVQSFSWFASVGDVRTIVRYIPPNAIVTVWGRYYERDLPGTTRDEMRLQYDRFHKCMVVAEGHEGKVYSTHTASGFALAAMGVAMALGVLYILLHPGVVNQYFNQ